MRFPWQHRADDEMRHRIAAEHGLERVQRQWPDVRAAVQPLRRERHLNGWTHTILDIFEGPPPGEGSR